MRIGDFYFFYKMSIALYWLYGLAGISMAKNNFHFGAYLRF